MRMNDFKYKLLDIINQSGLTIEEVYYIWKDLFDEISILYNNVLIQEKQKNKENEQNVKEEQG